MGWGSGAYVFNGIADALIEAGASEEIKHKALSKVIGQLRQEDWDTEYDSLQDYLNDPGIVAAFADHDIRWGTDE